HRALREQSKAEQQEYQRQLTEYTMTKDKTDMERPQEPPLKMLIIPANNSATGLFQILNDNKGIGLIFETEGDTLAQTFKSEHGNYSDGFRKAFHHEIISYNRRKDREFVELETPRLSALLSGTPKQVSALIPNAENGLFSRFIFYYMNILPVWKDVFAGDDSQTLDDYFRHLGNQFFDFYKTLQQQSEPLRFCLTATQQQAFNAYFSQAQNQYLYLCGVDYLATVRRLGLITFRIAMILTALRIMETGHITSPMICDNTDFSTALELVKILIQHAARIYETLPTETEKPKQPNQKQQFLETLPPEFSRKDYLATAKKLNIPDKTAEKHIARFVQNGLISHFAHDKYRVIRT
ncbi:MAG: YfjI family protein, partial [Bacteroidales bacterium]|nr:YfjI family protein [Bacteroidales bacterium]